KNKVSSIDDLVKAIDAERKAKDTTIANLQRTNGEQTKEIVKLADNLKDTAAALTKTADGLKAAQADLKKAQGEGATAVATLREVGEAVGSDFRNLKTSKDALVKEVKAAMRMAKSVDPKGTIQRLEKELAADRARLAQRWEPAQMLTYWLPILDNE